MVIYLQSISKFNSQTTDVGRFIIARNIIETSIDPKSKLTLNISYETRQNALNMMMEFESEFALKSSFDMNQNLFDDVTNEIHKLILENHWGKFVQNIKNMNNNNNLSCMD